MDGIREYMVPMEDGTKLYTAVAGGDGPKPVIFERTPYAGDGAAAEEIARQERLAVERGYAVVFQHCRGTGRSEGDFIPFEDERRDGLATLEWIRRQPFYAGEIYPRGGSYCSWVHLSYLGTRPPDVKGAALWVYDPDNFRILFRSGFFKSGMFASWYQKMYKVRGGCRKIWPGEDALRTLPHTAIPGTVFSDPACPLEEYLKHPDRGDPFWKGRPGFEDGQEFIRNLDIPVLFATSYHDIFWDGMYAMWSRELTPAQKAKCTMIVTPYEHNLDWNAEMPRQYPGGGLTDRYGRGVWTLDWLDHVRLGTDPGKFSLGKMVYYTLSETDGPWRKTSNRAGKRRFISRRRVSPGPRKRGSAPTSTTPTLRLPSGAASPTILTAPRSRIRRTAARTSSRSSRIPRRRRSGCGERSGRI